MTETLELLLEREGADAVLQRFGLERLLTEHDDPALWAAALARHWTDPGSPGSHPDTLRFGIGRVVPDDAHEPGQLARSGMEQLETWCFERVDEQRLRAVECRQEVGFSFMGAIALGQTDVLADPGLSVVKQYLDIARPSVAAERALVHAGMSMPPNAGSGERLDRRHRPRERSRNGCHPLVRLLCYALQAHLGGGESGLRQRIGERLRDPCAVSDQIDAHSELGGVADQIG